MLPEIRENTRRDSDRRVGSKNNIEALKNGIPIIDVADYWTGPGGLRKIGPDRWKGRCPIPDHEDKTASFVVYNDAGKFLCFGCGEHGDCIDLERLAGGYTRTWEAMLALSTRYGIELPGRSELWKRRQQEKKPILDLVEEVRKQAFRRRSFKVLCLPYLANIEDTGGRREAIEAAWIDYRDGLKRMGR